MFVRPFFILCAIFLGLGIITPAHAERKNDAKDIPNAEDLIKHCWDISEEKRATPNTAVMRAGNLDTALCLEQEIIKHASALLHKTTKTKTEIIKLMKTIRFSYGGLYWDLYNNNKGCDPFCGTENHIRHNWELAKLYEKILNNIIELRNKYEV